MSRVALPLAALYVVGRGYQDSSAPRLQPYLSLPIPRKTLVRFGLGHALLHPANTVFFAFACAFWTRTIIPSHPWMGSIAYGGGLLLLVGSATHLAVLCHRALGKRPLRVTVLITGGGLLIWLGEKTDLFPIFECSKWLFVGLLEFRAIPILLLVGGYAWTHALHRKHLRRRLCLDDTYAANPEATKFQSATHDVESGESPPDATTTQNEGLGNASPQAGAIRQGVDRLLPVAGLETIGSQNDSFHNVRALVALEWRLLSRNRQPRRLGFLFIAPVLLILLVSVGAASSASLSYEGSVLFLWGVAVGGWITDYGAKVLSWEGRRLEGILTCPVRPRDLLWAKLTTLGGGTLFLWVLPLPVLLFAGSSALALHTAFLIYVLGWGVPLALVGAPFNGTPVPLNDRSVVTASEFGLGRGGVVILLLGPAVGLFYWADSILGFAGGLVTIGGLSAVLTPLWIRLLRIVWERRHPQILEDFREAEG